MNPKRAFLTLLQKAGSTIEIYNEGKESKVWTDFTERMKDRKREKTNNGARSVTLQSRAFREKTMS